MDLAHQSQENDVLMTVSDNPHVTTEKPKCRERERERARERERERGREREQEGERERELPSAVGLAVFNAYLGQGRPVSDLISSVAPLPALGQSGKRWLPAKISNDST